MKRELRRIEETLNHLTASPQRVATANPQASASKGLSFDCRRDNLQSQIHQNPPLLQNIRRKLLPLRCSLSHD
ncbi:MAG: hypothetical protein HC936_12980 [Leptolyngbyaceae cyanobacterium SU_3_3]|nr:hypothetical protein [Leptolyngbyaceae cyanobacterium SU_3_3]